MTHLSRLPHAPLSLNCLTLSPCKEHCEQFSKQCDIKVTLSTQCNWGGVFAPRPNGEEGRQGRAGLYIVRSLPLCPPRSSLCSNFLQDSFDVPFPHSLRWPNSALLDLRIVFLLNLVSSNCLLLKAVLPMPDFEKGSMKRKWWLARMTSQRKQSRVRDVVLQVVDSCCSRWELR